MDIMLAHLLLTYAQYTPPTPTRLNSTVASHWRRWCVLGFRLTTLHTLSLYLFYCLLFLLFICSFIHAIKSNHITISLFLMLIGLFLFRLFSFS